MTSKILDMRCYGIQTFVRTTAERIDWYMNEYETQPDILFGGGLGKKNLMDHTLSCILREDLYFTKFQFAFAIEQQRWLDFLEDCMIYATLHCYLNGAFMPLLSEVEYNRILSTADEIRAFEISE